MKTPAIRGAVAADLSAVAAIYTYESEHAYSTFETQPRPLTEWEHKLATGDPFVVAVEDDRVVGFAYASPFRDRPAYHRTRETSVYVERQARASGIGTLLYATLLNQLRAARFHTALALIALPNAASVRLHEQHGFELVGTMREVGDKQQRLIDVAIYQLMVEPGPV